MPQQFLNGSDIVTILQQVRREAVTKAVTADTLCDVGCSRRISDILIQTRQVDMLASLFPGSRINGQCFRRENILLVDSFSMTALNYERSLFCFLSFL